jgi:serine/threonine protein kinase
MDHFIHLENCGERTYASRIKALHIDTLTYVCLKKREKRQILHSDLEVSLIQETMNSHPNFVHTLFVLEKFFVQEYIPQDCSEIFINQKNIKEENVKFILKNVLEALKFLHRKKIIHANICCKFFNLEFFDFIVKNIRIKENGEIKLQEGLMVMKKEGVMAKLPQIKNFEYKLRYRSPEMLLKRDFGTAADIWGLG